MLARVEADPMLMRRRRCASEHPFGTIKRMTAGGRFLTRGLLKTRAEGALSVLAYNIFWAINLTGAAALSAASPEKKPEAPEPEPLTSHTACERAVVSRSCRLGDVRPRPLDPVKSLRRNDPI